MKNIDVDCGDTFESVRIENDCSRNNLKKDLCREINVRKIDECHRSFLTPSIEWNLSPANP